MRYLVCFFFWAGIWKQYCHIWDQHPRICLIEKICEIMKMPKFGTKHVLFGCFWAEIWKQYCHISNQHPRICLIAQFRELIKMSKFETIINLGIFGLECYKAIVIFQNITLELVKLRNVVKKLKCLNLGPSMHYLGTFGMKFENNIVIFQISTLKFV